MEKKKAIEKIYELIENYNFDELSPEEQSFVLTHISEKEYRDMRTTVGDTIRYFSAHPRAYSLPSRNRFNRFLNYRLEIYKVAALFMLLLGLAIILSLQSRRSSYDLLAQIDTVYVPHTDTVHVHHWDTLEIVNERVVYRDQVSAPEEDSHLASRPPDRPGTELCRADICPGDLEHINRFNSKNDCSQDDKLKEFMVTLN